MVAGGDGRGYPQGHLLGVDERVEAVDGDQGAVGEDFAGEAVHQCALGSEAVKQKVVPGSVGRVA